MAHIKTIWFKIKRSLNRFADKIEDTTAKIAGLIAVLLKGLFWLVVNLSMEAFEGIRKRGRLFVFSLLFLAATIAFYVWTLWFFIELSTFSAALLKASVGYVLFALIDEFVWGKVDTLDQLVNQKNVAYALYFLAIAVIYAAALATA